MQGFYCNKKAPGRVGTFVRLQPLAGQEGVGTARPPSGRIVYNNSMKKRLSWVDRFYRARSTYYRLKRLAFPSPAEVKFLELMGARVRTFPYIRAGVRGFPLAIVLSRGKLLRQARLKREVRYGKHYVDFANDIHWVIEIDGSPYHQDVVADFDREVYLRDFLRKHGHELRLKRIPAPRLWNDRARVQREIIQFLNA